MTRAGAGGGAVGLAAAALQQAGALKSLPGLAALPLDLTLLLLLGLLPGAALLAAGRRWRLAPALAVPLLAALLLPGWMVLAGCWTPSRAVLAEKLPQAVLLGPAMLGLGLLAGAERGALRGLCAGTMAIGLVAGAAVAWGVAAGQVVLGGEPGADPEKVRVQYQLVGLAIAAAAGLAALRAAEPGPARPAWAAATAALAAAALVPGGRLALIALALVVVLAPCLLLWLRGRPRAALGWAAGLSALGGAAGAVLLLGPPVLPEGLRTLERLAGGEALQGAATPARLVLWAEALRWAGAALPLGLGTGGFTLAAGFGEDRGFHPHNHALEALAEGGLPGMLLWLLGFGGAAGMALARAGRVPPGRAARVAALVLPVALSVMVSTDLGNRTAWFALGLLLSVAVEAAPRRGG